MGSAKIYWQPVAADGSVAASYDKITLEDDTSRALGFASLALRPSRAAELMVVSNGLPRLVNYGITHTLTAAIRGLTLGAHSGLIRALRRMDSALTLGALCHITRDSDCTGVWPCRNAVDTAYAVPNGTDTTVYHSGSNLLGASLDAGTLTAIRDKTGNETWIVVETEPPEGHQSYAKVFAVPGSKSITTSDAIDHKTSAAQAYVRWADFYPGLYLAQSSMTEERVGRDTMTWSWEASFIYAPRMVFDLFP